MQELSREGLVITRKRKKWKFAHFDSYTNCFTHNREAPEATKQFLKNNFERQNSVSTKTILEIAAGNAQFSLELARRHPELNVIAADIKSDRLYKSAKQALEEGVQNIIFLRMPMNQVENVFEKNSIDTLWLTFPDPYPKKRSAKRRLSHISFLRQYRNILSDTGELNFKTDNRDLFLWSLEQCVAEKWQITELSFDLHESDLPEEYKIMTHYEQKFTAEGIPINYVTLKKA